MQHMRHAIASTLTGLALLCAQSSGVLAERQHKHLVQDAMPRATEIAKAMMAEAIVRACPSIFERVPERGAEQQQLLREGNKWSERQIAAKVRQLQKEGCDGVRAMYSRLRDRYPYIRLAQSAK